jgi:selenocysteine lyase/cysteine desulfurase
MSSFDFAPGDVIVTTQNDYISNQLMFLSLAAPHGIRVERAADAPEGGVDPDSLRTLVQAHRPKLVALTWIPTNSGLVQPAADVGAICEEFGIPFLIDACQAVGQIPIDVRRLKCDFLAATARKFLRGPRGIGFLYVSDAALARGAYPLLIDMRGANWTGADSFELFPGARRFEEWELPYALVLGMGAAVRYANEIGIGGISYRAHALAAEARRRIGAIPGVRALDHGTRLSAISTYSLGRHSAPEMVQLLRERGINTSSHTVADAPIDFARHGAASSLRVSPHYYNTVDDIGVVESALRELLAR